MFRTSADIDDTLCQRRLDQIISRLDRSDEHWFNGTIASVDRRLAHVNKALVFARGTVARIGSTQAGIRCADVIPPLEQAYAGLHALRHDLLNGPSARRGASTRAGQRVASHTVVAARPDFPDELIF